MYKGKKYYPLYFNKTNNDMPPSRIALVIVLQTQRRKRSCHPPIFSHLYKKTNKRDLFSLVQVSLSP